MKVKFKHTGTIDLAPGRSASVETKIGMTIRYEPEELLNIGYVYDQNPHITASSDGFSRNVIIDFNQESESVAVSIY